MNWHGDFTVLVYREKHRTYVVSVAKDNAVQRVEAADHWRVVGEVIEFCRWQSERVERLSLPELRPLPDLVDRNAAAQLLRREPH